MGAHGRRLALVLIGVCGLLGASVWAPPVLPSAAASTGTRVVELHMASGPTRLSGFETTPLVVQVHLVDPDGVVPLGGFSRLASGLHCPCLVLESFTSSGAPFALPQSVPYRIIELRLQSGDAADGVWWGMTTLSGVSAGIWRGTQITAGDLVAVDDGSTPWSGESSFVGLPPEVTASANVNIRSTDRPTLTIRVPSTPVPVGAAYAVTGAMRLSTSHRPVYHAGLVIGTGECSPWDFQRIGYRYTSAAGTWGLASRLVVPRWCAFYGVDARGINAIAWTASTTRFLRATITAVPATSGVRVGRPLKITGRANPLAAVTLQRYYAGRWHRVGSATLWPSTGAYRVYAYPPSGTWRYRTQVMSTSAALGATSRVFCLTGR